MEFFTLKAYGKGIYFCRSFADFLASLYAGALVQFTIGRIGLLFLWIFMCPQIFGGVGFRLI